MPYKLKLLILGANHETIPLVRTAIDMGVHTIVTDHIPHSAAKAVADESWDINGLDVESLYQRATDESINGVMVGVADRLVVSAAQLCEKMRLPILASSSTCEILSRKDAFNRECERFGIATIPHFHEGDLPDQGPLPFKCFVKPVDSNSGKGMSICSTREELEHAKRQARQLSRSGHILVERYMECDDTAIHLTIQNGVPHVSAVVDRYTTDENASGSRVCIGAVYPSRHTELYKTSTHPRISRLLSSLGVRNGVLTMQAFVENSTFHIYDPGFRLQGEGCDHHFRHTLRFDQREALVNFALQGIFRTISDSASLEWPEKGVCAATIWVLIKPGEISEIRGISDLEGREGVFHVAQRLFKGDTVLPEMAGTEQQVVARIYCCTDSPVNLKSLVSEVSGNIRVVGTAGDNLLLLKTLPQILDAN